MQKGERITEVLVRLDQEGFSVDNDKILIDTHLNTVKLLSFSDGHETSKYVYDLINNDILFNVEVLVIEEDFNVIDPDIILSEEVCDSIMADIFKETSKNHMYRCMFACFYENNSPAVIITGSLDEADTERVTFLLPSTCIVSDSFISVYQRKADEDYMNKLLQLDIPSMDTQIPLVLNMGYFIDDFNEGFHVSV